MAEEPIEQPPSKKLHIAGVEVSFPFLLTDGKVGEVIVDDSVKVDCDNGKRTYRAYLRKANRTEEVGNLPDHMSDLPDDTRYLLEQFYGAVMQVEESRLGELPRYEIYLASMRAGVYRTASSE